MLVGIIIEGNHLVGKSFVQNFRVEDGAVDNQTLQRNIIILLQHVDV